MVMLCEHGDGGREQVPFEQHCITTRHCLALQVHFPVYLNWQLPFLYALQSSVLAASKQRLKSEHSTVGSYKHLFFFQSAHAVAPAAGQLLHCLNKSQSLGSFSHALTSSQSGLELGSGWGLKKLQAFKNGNMQNVLLVCDRNNL